jgi:hypothetical protein
MKRPKACVVLNHLLHGGRSFKVTFKNETEPRTFVFDNENSLCELRKTDDGEEILLRFDVGLGEFVKMCEEIPDDELFLIGAETGMIEMNQERLRTREAAAERRRWEPQR